MDDPKKVLQLHEMIALNVAQEKWIFKIGGSWNHTTPVGKLGAVGYLTDHGIPQADAEHFLKTSGMQLKVYGTDIVPFAPDIFKNEAGLRLLNTWVPPRLSPTPGPFPTIQRVLERLVDQDAEGLSWLMQWLAFKVQNQSAVPKVAVVFGTKPGAGKGFLYRVMAEIFGTENCATVKQQELGNKFNARWIQKLFVMGDEVLSNENVKDISQLLKILIDGGQLELEGKFANQVAVRSRLAWMFASNDRVSPLVLEDADRRYTVFTNFVPVEPDFKKAMDSCFAKDRVALTEAFEAEICGLWDYLKNLDVDASLVSAPYSNSARKRLIAANQPSQDAFFDAVGEHGIDTWITAGLLRKNVSRQEPDWDFKEDGVSFEALYTAYSEYCRQNGMKALRSPKFAHAISNRYPPVEKRRLSLPRRPTAYKVKRSTE